MQNKTNIENINILLVEDSETDAYTLRRSLSKTMHHPCLVQHVVCMADAEKLLNTNSKFDLILLDLGLPDTTDNEDTFKRIKAANHDIPVIVLTSVHDHDLAVSIVDKGAEDYVRKSTFNTEPEILSDAIDFAICRHNNIEDIKQEAAKKIEEKDQFIHWVTGGYSVEPSEH